MAPRISVPSPCSADWADMTPAPGGRHCAACNKIVVDFTALSEADMLAALRQPGKVCGRFRPEQVASPTTAAFSWARWLASAAVALSSCETMPVHNEQSHEAPTLSTNQFLARGIIVDKATNTPIPHALIISEQDTTYHARAATDGSFQLQLPLKLSGTRLVAVLELERTSSDREERGFYRPKYFTATPDSAVTVRLRNPGVVLGSPALEPDECFSAVAMPYIIPQAPPPPPPKLLNDSLAPSSSEKDAPN